MDTIVGKVTVNADAIGHIDIPDGYMLLVNTKHGIYYEDHEDQAWLFNLTDNTNIPDGQYTCLLVKQQEFSKALGKIISNLIRETEDIYVPVDIGDGSVMIEIRE